MRRWQFALVILVAMLTGAGLSTYAHHAPTPATLTGCLVQSSGQLTKLKQSLTTPKSACGTGEVLVHVSGGDVTGVQTPLNGGLLGGGAGGALSLSLNFNQLDARYGGPGSRVTVISGSKTPVENGTALRTAVAAVSGATAASPWLIQLGPGTFDIGVTTLTLPDNVHLAGSGRGVSIVQSIAYAAESPTAIAAGSTTIRDVTIVAVDDSEWGTPTALTVNGESLMLSDVSLSGGGPFAYGMIVTNSTVRIFNSVVYGSAYSILDTNWNTAAASNMLVHDTEVAGRIVGNRARCFDVYDYSFTVLLANCQQP